MTRTGMALALLVSALTLSGAALAEQQPTPAETKREWLRPEKDKKQANQAAPASSSSSWRGVVTMALLAALGGGAVWYRKKQLKRAVPGELPVIRVVGAAKVGPKAHAVLTVVQGRLLLLGVTDSSVRKLAWLDGEPSAAEDDRPAALPRRASAASVHEETTEAPSKPRFREAFLGALGVSHAAPAAPANDAAVELARGTRDVVSTSSRASASASRAAESDFIDIERQAAGLAQRLRDRRA